MNIAQYATPTMIMLVIVLIVSLALYSKLIQAVNALVTLLRDLQVDLNTVRINMADLETENTIFKANVVDRLINIRGLIEPEPEPVAQKQKPRVQRKKCK